MATGGERDKLNFHLVCTVHNERKSNYWREYVANTIYIRPRVEANDVIAKQQIGKSERIKINYLIREVSI